MAEVQTDPTVDTQDEAPVAPPEAPPTVGGLAQDSAAGTIKLADLVNLEIPTGMVGAGYDTVGMVCEMQLPDAVLVKCRVAWLQPPNNQIPPTAAAGVKRVDPTIAQAWIDSNLLTIKASFAID